jgi:hypothetical protein
MANAGGRAILELDPSRSTIPRISDNGEKRKRKLAHCASFPIVCSARKYPRGCLCSKIYPITEGGYPRPDSGLCSEICPESGYRDRQKKSRAATLTGDLDIGCPTQWVEGDESCRSDAIDDRCGSGRATFVPMMESADLGKCDDLAS